MLRRRRSRSNEELEIKALYWGLVLTEKRVLGIEVWDVDVKFMRLLSRLGFSVGWMEAERVLNHRGFLKKL